MNKDPIESEFPAQWDFLRLDKDALFRKNPDLFAPYLDFFGGRCYDINKVNAGRLAGGFSKGL